MPTLPGFWCMCLTGSDKVPEMQRYEVHTEKENVRCAHCAACQRLSLGNS